MCFSVSLCIRSTRRLQREGVLDVAKIPLQASQVYRVLFLVFEKLSGGISDGGRSRPLEVEVGDLRGCHCSTRPSVFSDEASSLNSR